MAEKGAFDRAEFLGLARRAKRDPHRLSLFARHFEIGEHAKALLPIVGGTLVLTDQRLLHFTTHLDVDGAWNVREFTGYTVSGEIPVGEILDVRHSLDRGPRGIEEAIQVSTRQGLSEFTLSKGPERVVSDEDIGRVIALLTRRNPSDG